MGPACLGLSSKKMVSVFSLTFLKMQPPQFLNPKIHEVAVTTEQLTTNIHCQPSREPWITLPLRPSLLMIAVVPSCYVKA